MQQHLNNQNRITFANCETKWLDKSLIYKNRASQEFFLMILL